MDTIKIICGKCGHEWGRPGPIILKTKDDVVRCPACDNEIVRGLGAPDANISMTNCRHE